MNSRSDMFPTEIIILDQKSSDTGSQERSVRSYASRVFQESTIGMVASIASTHSRARRVFKSLLLALCISGFLYQSITFLLHVFEYPTVVDVDIERPKSYNIPAYTFCSNNGMKRSVFCSLYPDRCYEPSQQFCSKFYSYCGANKTLVPKKQFYEVEESMTYQEILEHGANLDEFFVSERSNIMNYEEPNGPFLRTKHEFSGAMICYNLHSVIEDNKKPTQKKKFQAGFQRDPLDVLSFYIEENEMFIPGNRPGVLFSIHSPFEAVNPFIKGIFMKPGRTYKIFVRMSKEILLKEPFQTNCLNYEEFWEANNRTGPRIQEMCYQKCLLDFSLASFNCAVTFVLYPTNRRLCNRQDFAPSEDHSKLEENILRLQSCFGSCRDDCSVTKYVPEITERYEVNYVDDETLNEFQRYITVEIILEDEEIMTIKHSPKYMVVEIFSTIGGFIGCWLGIALMDIIDVFGGILTVFRYSFKRKRKV